MTAVPMLYRRSVFYSPNTPTSARQVAKLSAANILDSKLLRLLVRELPAISGLKGRPRKRTHQAARR